MSKGWIERYRALLRGVRSGLTNPTWQANSKFMGYNAFGSWVMGDISNWEDHALDYAGHIDPGPEMWDGGAPSYYAAINAGLTDYQVRSPQIGAMNYIFMQDQAASYNPQFWFNLSVWDGHVPRSPKDSWATYSSQGQTFTPTRYSGFVQFGLWLTQPRLILDYRNYPDSYDEVSPYMQQVMAAVDRIYGSAELQAFWRKGELVPNPERPNPFNLSIPPEYQGVNRWFLLSTNLDPPDPWKLQNTEILAYAIARVIGTAPQRRWLVYAFSPLGDRPGVKIKIPGYAPGMEIPVTQGGSFYSVSESSGVVSVVR
jgi:hypothetical protein